MALDIYDEKQIANEHKLDEREWAERNYAFRKGHPEEMELDH
jgi:hypothetical protein